MTDAQKQIDELTLALFNGSTQAYEALEQLKMTTINIKISVAKLSGIPEARALSTIADYIANSVEKLEKSTMTVKEISKQIGVLNKEKL